MTASGYIPDDPALPGLHELLAHDGPPPYVVAAASGLTMAAFASWPAERSYTRYWPGRRCVAQWSFVPPSGKEPVIISAELLSEQEARRGRTGEGAFLAEQRTWVQVFPHDRVLPAITTAVSQEYIGRVIAPLLGAEPAEVTARALSYKSWRRCVIEYSAGGKRVYGKLFRDDRGASLANTLQQFEKALLTSGAPWTIPETLLYDAETRMLVSAELQEAASLSDVVTKAPGDDGAMRQLLDAVRAAAEGLSSLQVVDGIEGLEVFSAQDAFDALRDDFEAVALVEPEYGERLRGHLRQLDKLVLALGSERQAPAHSAFRHSHIYLSPGGLSLLDLDNLRLSGVNADAGYFLAYLEYSMVRRRRVREVLKECKDAFLDSWSRQPAFDAGWLAFHSQYVLLKWAVRSFFSLDENWRQTMDRSLRRAAGMLHREVSKAPGEVEDSVLTIALSRSRMQDEIATNVGPRLWPGGGRVEVVGIEMSYHPGEQCVVVVDALMGGSEGNRKERAIMTFMQPQRFEATLPLVQEGPAVVLSREHHYLAEAFPHDYLLPGLGLALDDGHALEVLTRAGIVAPGEVAAVRHEVLRYRPHERCVIRYVLTLKNGETRRYVAKVYDGPETSREVWTTLNSLRSQLADPTLIVAPLALDEGASMVVMENIEGERVGDLMDETRDEGELRRYVEMTAVCLASLHGLSLDHDRVKTFETEIGKLRVHEDSAGSVSGEMGEALGKALDAIMAAGEHLPQYEPGFVHGGFKPTQMLLRPDGRVTVVDFDGSCVGDSAIDVGRFMAKIRADAMGMADSHLQGLDQFFLDSYNQRAARQVREHARVYQAMSLVRMASRRFETRIGTFKRRGLTGGPSGAILREAMACLELAKRP